MISRRLLKWQLLACGFLVVVFLLEWTLGEVNRAHLRATLEQKIQADYQAEPLPALNAPKQAADGLNAVVERPLFIEGRKPLPEQSPAGSDVADNGQLDDWLLIGIYNKHQRKVALFRKQNEPKTFLKINESQMISGWELVQIQADRVVLQQGGQQKSIMLRKPRPQGKLPSPARPAPATKPVIPQAPTNNDAPENDNNDS